jgi:hypothetical protein
MGGSSNGCQKCLLHKGLLDEIYTQQQPRFVQDELAPLVCSLKKYLDGLKQAPYPWYEKIHNIFLNCGFSHCKVEPNPYLCLEDGQILIIVLYVDDFDSNQQL